MIILTEEFINKHRTKNGGFTKKQLNAIGIEWPPPKNWLKKSIGKQINAEQVNIFKMNNLLENQLKKA